MHHNKPVEGVYKPRFSQIATMMRLPVCDQIGDIDIGFVGVPFDMGTYVRPGARLAPAQIRDMSRFIRNVHVRSKIKPYELANVADLGDAPVNPMNIQGSLDAIEEFYTNIASKGVIPLSFGGDHTIPLVILRGLKKGGAFKAPVGLIHLDAHADVLPHDDGEEVNHGTFVRLAVQKGLVDPSKIVQMAMRGSEYSDQHYQFGHDHNIRKIYQYEIDQMGISQTVEEIHKIVGSHPVYFTLDIDGLDPTCCPGTGFPEPGGLTMRETQAIMFGCRGINIIGGDVCEVSPPFDPSGMTALNAANLLFEMLCLTAENFHNSNK